MDFKSKKLLILTGAGFTHNFGGFLSKEMWAEIFNSPLIQGNQKLRQLLQDNEDYEYIYSEVLSKDTFTEGEKFLIKEVVESAYKNLDDVIKGWVFNSDNPNSFNIYGLGEFLNLFMGRGEEKGLFFTLNQDLIMERRNGYRCPGVPAFQQEFYSLNSAELKKEGFVQLPGVEDALKMASKDIRNHSGLIYIKLHGSYGWKASDGSNQMVIGKNKTELINREPILNYYFNIFQDVIKEGNKNLLIIGYGFRDQHINNVILDGVKNHNLKIYIIDVNSFHDLKSNMENGHFYATPLLEGVGGYFPYSFRQIFPPDQSKTVSLANIVKILHPLSQTQ
jgi:hypothetical protein